jgi:hypothetical protein
MMRLKLGLAVLAFVAVFTGCAPAARQSPQQRAQAEAEAARPRFTLKTGEVWQMTAFKPGNQESQRFPLELYGPPELDEDGFLVADAEADRYEARVFFFPEDDTLGVLVVTSSGQNPNIVLCGFERAGAGKARYEGESFFGRLNELSDDLPDNRYARCLLEKK